MPLDAIETELNRIAQSPRERWVERARTWFESLTDEQRERTARLAALYAGQASVRPGDLVDAGIACAIPPRCTPARIAARAPTYPMRVTLHQLSRVTGGDRARAFLVLAYGFFLADERRRATRCRADCTHEWHRLPPAGTE